MWFSDLLYAWKNNINDVINSDISAQLIIKKLSN